MGRPKGMRDSKPRTRRTKAALQSGRAVAMPGKLTARARNIKRQVKAIARDLFYNEIYIVIGLAVSGIQLAVTFTYITPSFWGSALSVVSAAGKASFIEGGVWLMNRAFSHARATGVHWAWQLAIVFIAGNLMWVSTRANLRYEWEKKVEIKFPQGECVKFKKDDVTCVQYRKINVNETNVDKYLSPGEQSDAVQRGGLIPLLVFASIIIGRVMLASKDGFEAEEMRRLRESERGIDYRERKKRAVIARVEKAEAVGLEAGDV